MVICYVDVFVDIMVGIFHVCVQHVATLLAGMHLLQNYSSKEAGPGIRNYVSSLTLVDDASCQQT